MTDFIDDLEIHVSQAPEALDDDEWIALAMLYKSSFAGEPWFEVGKCPVADPPEGSPCQHGMSPIKRGERCNSCGKVVREDAYPLPDLLPTLDEGLVRRRGILYREASRSKGLLLAAIFWLTDPKDLSTAKYGGSEEARSAMELWLTANVPTPQFLWLDEIFADRTLRSKKNLWNIVGIFSAAASLTHSSTVAFRSVNERLLLKTEKSFRNVTRFSQVQGLPDDRPFILIQMDEKPARAIGVSAPTIRPDVTAPMPGFPEWLPGERAAEMELIDRIRTQCERFGYAPVETPAVERMDTLAGQGGIINQIFTVGHPIESASPQESIGLHFDLTVPLARYVATHRADLVFPFRRYQVQKVWRSESTQRGRYEEFYQCDFDIVGDGELAQAHDPEVLALAHSIFAALDVRVAVRVSSTRILDALLEHFQLPKTKRRTILQAVEQCDRMGPAVVASTLRSLKPPGPLIAVLSDVLQHRSSKSDLRRAVANIPAALAGIAEVEELLESAVRLGVPGELLALDASLVRGLDYYTGTIFETTVVGHEGWGSVCSGGRYEELATAIADRPFPGVGGSIGVTRLFALLLGGQVARKAQSPASVALLAQSTSAQVQYSQIARELRAGGLNVEVSLKRPITAAIAEAERKGIPFVVLRTPELGDKELLVRHLPTRQEWSCQADAVAEQIATARQ